MPSPSELSREKFVHDLETLVSFRTVSGKGEGFNEAFDFIQANIHPDAHVQMLENEGEQVLLAANVQTLTPDIVYLVHVDVVGVENEALRDQLFTVEHQPDGDTVVGRGVNDMKFSIPIGYGLLNRLIDHKSELSFSLAITTDEERGGFKGAKYLFDEYGLRPKLAIVPDGGRKLAIVNKSKGVCQLQVMSKGESAHASSPWKGKDATIELSKFHVMLAEEYAKNNAEKGWHTTMNTGYILATSVPDLPVSKLTELHIVNKVLDRAYLGLDFRIPETITPNEMHEKVAQMAKDAGFDFEVNVTATGESTWVDPELPVFKLYKEVLEKHYQREIGIEGGYGSSDARHVNKYGVPFLMSKPDGDDSHGDRERISISSTMTFYYALIEFLESYEKVEKSK